jgi:hypothetical protein
MTGYRNLRWSIRLVEIYGNASESSIEPEFATLGWTNAQARATSSASSDD